MEVEWRLFTQLVMCVSTHGPSVSQFEFIKKIFIRRPATMEVYVRYLFSRQFHIFVQEKTLRTTGVRYAGVTPTQFVGHLSTDLFDGAARFSTIKLIIR
jgi:hypothetical protein